MKHEFHAEYPFALKDSVPQVFAIEWLVGKSSRLPHSWPEVENIQDPFQRIALLSQALLTAYKEQARMGTRREPGGLRFWLTEKARAFLVARRSLMDDVGMLPTIPGVEVFPPGSWSLQLTFTLRKPYLSRDDTDFYLLDNPVKKEWVFKVPYVAPSQWKGALRAAMRRLRGYTTWEEEAEDEQMVRLFGSVKGVETGFNAGRLHFYPTFFDKIGLEVINPHDRSTGAGKQPIYFECVPPETTGEFALLYVPLDGASRKEALGDLEAVAAGVRAMLTRYGFGAKTSSGYGVAESAFARDEENKARGWVLFREASRTRRYRCGGFAGVVKAVGMLQESDGGAK